MEAKIMVEVSARHLHLSQADLETLFGKGAELHHKKDLSQPGQFACEERVDIVGPKRTLTGVSVLGPVRPQTQVEISMTDARSIGLNPPIRESGVLDGSAGCKIIGPKGEVEIKEGLVVAKRHIHATTADAAKYDLKDKEIVCVKVESPDRTTIFDDVVVRVRDDFAAAMHIDTDEANAAGINGTVDGIIIKK